MSDTKVYAPEIRARLGTTAHFCEVVVLELRTLIHIASTAKQVFIYAQSKEMKEGGGLHVS